VVFQTIGIEPFLVSPAADEWQPTQLPLVSALSGSVCLLVAALAWWLGLPQSTSARWTLTAVLFVAGAFQLYEAKRSWCVMRACGVRTPM